MSMGPTSEPQNFPAPPPVTPSEGQLAVPGDWVTPAVSDSGPGIMVGDEEMAPANAPGPLIVPGDNQPDSDPVGIVTAPPGTVSDAGNDDKMESTVAGSMTTAMARLDELQGDLDGLGSTVGDLMGLPVVPSDFGKGSAGINGPLPSSDIQDV